MANPNFQLLVDAAKLLRPILGELVFVGGCTTALLVTDKGAADVRATSVVAYHPSRANNTATLLLTFIKYGQSVAELQHRPRKMA